MRFHSILALTSSALFLASATSSAQVTALSVEGDVIAGVGAITMYDNIAINSAGDWLAEVRTDHSNAAANKVLLKNGAIYMREGQAMSAPAGAIWKSMDSCILNDSGNTVLNLTVTVGGNDIQAVYWNNTLLMQEGDQIAASAGLSPGATYTRFEEVRLNSSEQVAVICEVDDSVITGTDDYVIMIWDTDGAGNITSETVYEVLSPPNGGAPYKAQEEQPGGTGSQTITNFNLNPHMWSFGNGGEVMCKLTISSGSSGTDDVVYIGGEIAAEESFQAPGTTANWNVLTSPKLSVNSAGDWSLLGGVGGVDMIFKRAAGGTTAPIYREGDSLQGMNGNTITFFGSGPVEIANTGDILYWCRTSNSDNTQNTGLWVNDTRIVQKGVTPVGANTIKTLPGVIDAYHFAPNGQYVIFEATLDDNRDGVFLVPVSSGSPPGTPMCFGDGTGANCPCGNFGTTGTGCANSTGAGGVLSATGTPSVGANALFFAASGLPSDRPALLVSNIFQGSAAFGDGALCIGSGWAKHSVVFSSSSGTINWGPSQMTNANWTA